MKKGGYFITHCIMSAIRLVPLFLISLVLMIVGALWIRVCLYIGLGVLALYLIACLLYAVSLQRLISFRTDDDSEFNEMMDNLSDDPKGFLAEIMAEQAKNKNLHGDDLLALSDEDLFETVYFQLQDLDDTEDSEEESALQSLSGARRVVYILSLFDAEVQNGGLCQFFVNSSRIVAPFVSDSLERVGAVEHRRLLDNFVTVNGIDLSDLSSFKASGNRGYIKQTKRFDFHTFDDRYYDLPPLQELVTTYIRANIQEF